MATGVSFTAGSGIDGPRRRRGAVLLAAAAVVGVAAASLVAPPPKAAAAPKLIHAYNWHTLKCLPAAQGTVRAYVGVRMVVVNYDDFWGRDWATKMSVKARIVPTTAGVNYSRSWRTWNSPKLSKNRRYVLTSGLGTDNVSPNLDWRVQVKVTWHRKGAIRNITKTFTRPFDTSCAAGAPGTPPVTVPRQGE
jgi:hypothetical protein